MISKKLLAIMIVPMLLILGGSVAFSAWSGSANSTFSGTTATVSYTASLQFVGTNADLTPLSITGASGPVTSATPSYNIATVTGGQSNNLVTYANATVGNLVPGNYAQFTLTITNTGTATLNTPDLIIVSSANGEIFANGQSYGNSNTFTVSGLQPPVSPTYLSALLSGTVPDLNGIVIELNSTSTTSTPSVILPGQSFSYTVYVLVTENAPMSQMDDYGLSMAIEIPITVAQ